MTLALVGALVGWIGGWVVDQRAQSRGAVYGVPPRVELADHSLGVTVDLLRMSAAERAQFYEQARRIGIQWIRLPISWRAIDKRAPGALFDWSKLDPLIGEIRAQRVYGLPLNILAVLKDLPDWTLDPKALPDGQPPQDWRVFSMSLAHDVSLRYKGEIAAYQIWDEPNLAANWLGHYPDPIAYTRLLRASAITIRANDPNAKIISAALAPTMENGPLNINEPEFLRQMYRAGAGEFFDALGAEPFGFWSGPDDRRVDVNVLNFSRIVLLRELMQANGDEHKAIWATSFGWYVKGAGDSPFGGDTAAVQTSRTLDAIRRARDEWPWLGPLMFARWQSEGDNDPRAGFALLSPTASPLLQSLVHDETFIPPATVGHYHPLSPSALYPGSWLQAPEGADIPRGDASPLKIFFRGTRFDLTVRRGPYEGFLFVTVDGAPANALPRDEQGRSYVVLYDPLAQTAAVSLARDLADKEHRVEIVPQGGWGQWAIAGWIVSRERDETMWPMIGAVVGVLVFGVSGRVIGRMTNDERRRSNVRALFSRQSSYVLRYSAPLVFAAGSALYLSPSAIISWLLIALLAVLIVWRLDAGLALVAFAIPFYLQPKPLGVGSYAVVEIALWLCVMSFAAKRLTGDGRRWTVVNFLSSIFRQLSSVFRLPSFGLRLSSFDWLVLLWLIAGGLGVLAAENFGVANREFRVVFVEPALYYFLLRLYLTPFSPSPLGKGGEGMGLIVNAFLAGAAIVSAKAIADWITHSNLITAEGVLRVRSVYFSPNNLALYLDRAAPLALSLALFGRSRRLLFGIAFALMLSALYLTFAKGAWLLALPAALLFIGLMRGRRPFMAALIALALLALSLWPVLGTERLQSLLDVTSGTTFIRVQVWQSAIAMIRDHPLFGVGLDNFLYQYRTRYILPSAFAEPNLSHPHNILLDFWTRLGLFGVVLLIALLIVFWRKTIQLYRHQSDGDARALTLGLMASMAAALAHGLIDNSFFLVDLAFVLMLTLSVLSAES